MRWTNRKDREDVGSHQGADTLAAFVRISSRVSGGISMSSFLARNNAQTSQICEGDTYPTIGVVLTVVSMCISSMRPTTVCSVVKDALTVTATNSSLTSTVSRASGGIVMTMPLLRRPCRQLQVTNHHRYRNLTKQEWKCRVLLKYQHHTNYLHW